MKKEEIEAFALKAAKGLKQDQPHHSGYILSLGPLLFVLGLLLKELFA